jgi:hypothetical protein
MYVEIPGKCIPASVLPPFFPDVAPADLWLFSKLKSVLKGKHFTVNADVRSSVGKKLADIPVQGFKYDFE